MKYTALFSIVEKRAEMRKEALPILPLIGLGFGLWGAKDALKGARNAYRGFRAGDTRAGWSGIGSAVGNTALAGLSVLTGGMPTVLGRMGKLVQGGKSLADAARAAHPALAATTNPIVKAWRATTQPLASWGYDIANRPVSAMINKIPDRYLTAMERFTPENVKNPIGKFIAKYPFATGTVTSMGASIPVGQMQMRSENIRPNPGMYGGSALRNWAQRNPDMSLMR